MSVRDMPETPCSSRSSCELHLALDGPGQQLAHLRAHRVVEQLVLGPPEGRLHHPGALVRTAQRPRGDVSCGQAESSDGPAPAVLVAQLRQPQLDVIVARVVAEEHRCLQRLSRTPGRDRPDVGVELASGRVEPRRPTAPARHAAGLAVRGHPPGRALALRRPGVPGRLTPADLQRLARANGAAVRAATRLRAAASVVDLRDPSGVPVRVVAGVDGAARLLERSSRCTLQLRRRPPGQRHRSGRRASRRASSGSATSCWRRRRSPARLDWYLEQPRPDRQRLPVLPRPARPRPDDGVHPLRPRQPRRPTTTRWRMVLGPGRRYVHSAYQVADLDAVAAGRRVPEGARLPATPGASAGTSRAARSSTTGATRTA